MKASQAEVAQPGRAPDHVGEAEDRVDYAERGIGLIADSNGTRKTFLNFPPSAPNHFSNFVGPLIVIDDLSTLELFCHLSGEVCGLREL